VRVDVAFMRTPDGHGQVELTKFHNPAATNRGVSRPTAPPSGPLPCRRPASRSPRRTSARIGSL
jgi:hypothetical protein